MLACETAGEETQDYEDLAVVVSQLGAAGIDARISARTIPERLLRNAQFDLAPYLFDRPLCQEDELLLVAAHRLNDERLVALRRSVQPKPRVVIAVGAFSGRQAIIGVQAKLSYIFGADPVVLDLSGDKFGAGEGRSGLPVFGVPVRRAASRPRLLLVVPKLADLNQARALQALALSSRFEVAVLTDGESKQTWLAAQGRGIPFFHFGEVLPVGLARRVDLCVTFAAMPTSYRVQSLFANLLVSGAALIDGTPDHRLAEGAEVWIPGPSDVITLGAFLQERILPNLSAIEMRQRNGQMAARITPAAVLERMALREGTQPTQRLDDSSKGTAGSTHRVIFVPTNGIGLGHAQRCAQIARNLNGTRGVPVFAAFPGCMRLIKTHGFDVMPLVSRSDLHERSHENDLVNYLRLRSLAEGASALVFDGGYVFDSVYRTIIETGVSGIWIRRGLWQTSQDNSVALDREKAFARVIVPGEAFQELNRNYSRGEHLRPVGPVVPSRIGQEAGRALREQLSARFGSFERLMVSLLGAGVAADRSAQVQALAGMMERRSDVLHLVVAWPAAVLQPGWFGWKNTRIVKTYTAGALSAAADLMVSAAGYNTFLEVLYGAVPAIFIPQMGPFMDDQRARANAAAERGLSGMVEPTELVTLERLVQRYLEGESEAVRTRLLELELPEPGNAAAAAVIEEVLHGI